MLTWITALRIPSIFSGLNPLISGITFLEGLGGLYSDLFSRAGTNAGVDTAAAMERMSFVASGRGTSGVVVCVAVNDVGLRVLTGSDAKGIAAATPATVVLGFADFTAGPAVSLGIGFAIEVAESGVAAVFELWRFVD